VDEDMDTPLDAADVLNNLQESNAQEELANAAGLQVEQFSAMVPGRLCDTITNIAMSGPFLWNWE